MKVEFDKIIEVDVDGSVSCYEFDRNVKFFDINKRFNSRWKRAERKIFLDILIQDNVDNFNKKAYLLLKSRFVGKIVLIFEKIVQRKYLKLTRSGCQKTILWKITC